MFQTIASDLAEFASCVTMDTTSAVTAVTQDAINTLERIDEAIGQDSPPEAEQEAIYRMALRDIYLSPLTVVVDDTIGLGDSSSFEQEQISRYFETFDIESKTDEISELLQQHEVLQAIFEELVPVEVSYRAFWERYFFRCDASMIQEAWDFQRQLDAKALNEGLATAKAIAAVPGRVMNGVVVQPMNFLAGKIASSLSPVSSATGLQAKSKGISAHIQQKCSRQELEDLQMAISTSNKRIASLRQNLDTTRKQLEATEQTSRSLEEELASAKVALDKKEHHAKTLESKIQEITISVDNTSNTASSTEVSGFEESSNGEEDTATSVDVESCDDATPQSSSQVVSSTIVEDESGDESENGWNNDDYCYGSDLELLMM